MGASNGRADATARRSWHSDQPRTRSLHVAFLGVIGA